MNWKSDSPPPEGLGPSDLAGQLCIDMGVGRSQPNMLAASEALLIKGTQPKFTTSSAYTFIIKRWKEYQASENYRSKFRRKAADWLNEGDYDNPATWGGQPDIAFKEQRPAQPGVRDWEKHRREHPEEYVPVSNLFDEMKKIFKAKKME